MERVARPLFAVAVLCLWSAAAGVPDTASRPNLALTVRIYNQAAISARMLRNARDVAEKIFRGAGIEIHWRFPGDNGRPDLDSVRLTILENPAKARLGLWNSDAGSALILQEGFSNLARIYFDNVEKLSFDNRKPGAFISAIPLTRTQSAILGLVMAHEIGHLLLGLGSHRADGVMAPAIRATAIYDAYRGSLQFDSDQAARLRFEVMARALHDRGFASLREEARGILECDLLAAENEAGLNAGPAPSR